MKSSTKAIFAFALILAIAASLAALMGGEEPRTEASAPEFSAVEVVPAQARPAEDEVQVEGEEPTEEEADVEEAPTETAEVEPDPPKRPTPRKSPVTRKAEAYKAAVLQIITNFEKADVTVNGLKYPEYYEPGEPEGMVLPAGGPYQVLVTFGGNTKEYVLHLRAHETRLLLVELSGYNSDSPRPAPPQAKAAPQKEPQKAAEKPDPKAPGRITVYSKPAGTVVVDGKATGDKTPGTVELENGRHEVQVQYETGTISEKKIVRVRTGSRIKLFFRERTK